MVFFIGNIVGDLIDTGYKTAVADTYVELKKYYKIDCENLYNRINNDSSNLIKLSGIVLLPIGGTLDYIILAIVKNKFTLEKFTELKNTSHYLIVNAINATKNIYKNYEKKILKKRIKKIDNMFINNISRLKNIK